MKKSRGFISFVLAITLMLSIGCITVNADAIKSNSASTMNIIDDSGNKLTFVTGPIIDGISVMKYYYNDVLDRVYLIPNNGTPIVVKSLLKGTAYTIQPSTVVETSNCSRNVGTRAYGPYQDVGYFTYKYSSHYNCTAHCNVAISSLTNSTQYSVTCPQGAAYADILATISGALIAYGLSSLVSPTIAAAILSELAGYYGAEVINGFFNKLFSDTYTCKTTLSDVRTMVIGSGITSYSRYYTGFEKWATCRGYNGYNSEYTTNGVTPRNWFSTNNGLAFWNDALSSPCPGINNCTIY